MSDTLEEFVQDLGQGIVNIILYIPRRIYGHFKYIKDLEQEVKELENQIADRDRLLRRIKDESKYYKTSNQLLSYVGFCKIEELANTFPNDN